MPEKDDVSKGPEERKLKRDEPQPVAEGPMCAMCGGGKLMWVLWVVIIVLIVLAFLR